MANRWTNTLSQSDVTPEAAFLNRRQLIAGAAAGFGLAGVAGVSNAQEALTPNSWEDITQYNNFYEFWTGKTDPAEYAGALTTTPWTV